MIVNKKVTIRLERGDIEALLPECPGGAVDYVAILHLLRKRVSGSGGWYVSGTSGSNFLPDRNKGQCLYLPIWMEIESSDRNGQITEEQIDAVWILIGR